jgi:serine/threonine-protein kinase RsbT
MFTDTKSKPSASADVLEEVMEVLCRYVSSTTATSTMVTARRRSGAVVGRFDRTQLRETLPSIDKSLRLFLADPRRVEECLKALEALASAKADAASPAKAVVAVRVEEDVVRVRNEARELALGLGFSLTGRTRLATAVSELARNIVQYAGQGEVELRPSTSQGGLEIVARDRGPGIGNLEDIMAGNYRSKLGMGRGLRGVKQLADRFDIVTEVGKGTTVTFFLKVV